MKKIFIMSLFFSAVLFTGCRAVYDVERSGEPESSIVFTRSARFTPFFGSYSLREFVEITYERVSRNAANQMVVEVGIRNRGPVAWTNWYKKAPQRITLKARCTFFDGVRNASPAVFATNQQEIVIGKGETYYYRAVCPNQQTRDYQLVLGD